METTPKATEGMLREGLASMLARATIGRLYCLFWQFRFGYYFCHRLAWLILSKKSDQVFKYFFYSFHICYCNTFSLS